METIGVIAWERAKWTRMVGGLIMSVCLALVPLCGTAAAESASPPFIPPTASWLTTVNYYRAMAGLGPVAEDTTMSAGAYQHSCYMLQNGITHYEDSSKPGYTAAGAQAGSNGNVAVSSVYNQSARSHVELWMSGPFHAIGVLRPNLHTTGFGKCDSQNTPTPWHSAATLNVLQGLANDPLPTQPILFPGDGTTTNLDRFVVESPNPLDSCPGWTAPAGLPVIAMMPESSAGASSSITGPNGQVLSTCTVSVANTTGVANQILAGNNAVVAIPRAPLTPGTYHVTITTNARTVSWGFTVDPQAATGITPTQDATPMTGASALQPLVPNRVVDTRVNLGTSKLIGGSPRRIQITGVGGVPAGATAALVNVTATGAGAPGFLTLWNCGVRPDVSTLNFLAGETVPNSASVPLDSTGGLCAYAWSTTDMVIDVTGYYSSAGTARYNPVVPARLMDTRVPIGPSGRLAGGQTVELQVTGSGGVPAGATAVALNVTSDDASSDGYVTVYPCSSPRPDASSLNPKVDKSRANLVVTKLSPTGTVCLFTLRPTELVVDAFGYYSASGTMFTAATPFRFTDTRQTFNNDLNGGLGGARLNAGQVLTIPMAGIRGVPASAKAISANVTVTEADGPGWLAAWPCGPRSGISTVNFGWVTPVANAAIMPLSSSGSICVLSYTNAHVVIDVNGWWA